MPDKRANIKLDLSIHEKMKQIVLEKGNTSLTEEYEKAIKNYIAEHYQEKVMKDSRLEKYLDEKFSRMDKHLSSMLGRTGMDTSMILMGLLYFMENHFQEPRQSIFEIIKKDGARYYTTKE